MPLIHTPLVSICIPTYNQLDFFKNALNSVFNQSFDDYEIIVTDDSSDDQIYRYLEKESYLGRVRYIKNNPALGSPKNWNKAISLARGKFIKILHHDDQFFNESSLGKFVKAIMSHPDVDMVFCAVSNVDLQTGGVREHQPSASDLQNLAANPSVLLRGNFIGPPSATLIRAPIKYLFDEQLKWLVDLDFYIGNWRGNKINYIPEALVKVSTGGLDQVTRLCEGDRNIHLFEYFTVFNKVEHGLTVREKNRCIRYLKIILTNFNVQSIRQIRQAGYMGPIPQKISLFIPFIRLNQIIAKCLARL